LIILGVSIRKAIFHGRVWKFGNDVDTDVIIPVHHTIGTDLEEFGKHCMEGLDPHFAGKVSPGDMIVAGTNFGCGSSREHAPLALKGCGIAAVIARSFAGIFFRNAINIGLPFLQLCQKDINSIKDGDLLEIDLANGIIKNLSRNKTLKSQPFPKFLQEIIKKGGLMNYIKNRLIR